MDSVKAYYLPFLGATSGLKPSMNGKNMLNAKLGDLKSLRNLSETKATPTLVLNKPSGAPPLNN